MKAVCYISRFAQQIDKTTIDTLVNYVTNHNATRNITGVLLIKNKHFFQILEGENDAIDRLFENIKRDNRHSDVIKLLDLALEDRVFEEYNSGNFEVFEKDKDLNKLATYFEWIKNANYLPADQLIQLTSIFLKQNS